MRTIVHTLGFNTPSMIGDTVRSLIKLNEGYDYEHILVDLGYPLMDDDWEKIPKDIRQVKAHNLLSNAETAWEYDSQFAVIPNIGVSQNWTTVAQMMDITEDDVLICADPDERPQNNGWVKAISEVIQADRSIGWCSLMMKEQEELLNSGQFYYEEHNVAGHRVYYMKSLMNWAQGGFNGRFIKKAGGVPTPTGAKRYGWIETACMDKFAEHDFKYVILADYYVTHIASSPLAGEWKQYITSNLRMDGRQISFEEWLLKTKG